MLIEKDKLEFKKIRNESENVIEELHLVSKCVRRMVKEINPSLLFDLKKYHLKAWENFVNYKEKFIYDMVYDNLLASFSNTNRSSPTPWNPSKGMGPSPKIPYRIIDPSSSIYRILLKTVHFK